MRQSAAEAIRRTSSSESTIAASTSTFVAEAVPSSTRAWAPARRAATLSSCIAASTAAFGAGFILGPAIGGLLGGIDPRLPFWVAGGLSVLNGMYGLLVLPESLSHEHRSPFSWKRANPVGSLRMLKNNQVLLGLSAVLVLGYLAQQSLMNVYVLYADYRFGWTDRSVGLSLALVAVFAGLYGATLVKPLVKRVGERNALSLGLVGGTLGYCMFGWSKTGVLLLCGMPVLNLMSVAWPSAQSIMSREVKPSEQGRMQGAVQSLRGLAGIFGPILFTYIFSKSYGPAAPIHAPGAAFFTAGGLLVVSLAVAQWLRRPGGSGASAA